MTDRPGISGKDLLEWGVKQGPWFRACLEAANRAIESGADPRAAALAAAPKPVETVPLRARGGAMHFNAEADTDAEASNLAAVREHMTELMRVPTIEAGAVMPDACPAGSAPGTIPVGGVVATKDAIHPGFHSADICCSVAATFFDDRADPTAILDAGMKLTHFGGGGRPRGAQWRPPAGVLESFEANRFLAPLKSAAMEHFGTQGDGNHFFYVGRLRSSGAVALVTHHGSRGPGAMLYKAGMKAAQAHTRRVSPRTPAHNAWIDANSDDGRAYWEALQIIRAWTKAGHFAIHDAIAEALNVGVGHRFWNEHNFVFRKPDGLFYHGKGATPAWKDFADDSTGLTLIPLNMAEPILIVEGRNAPHALGFSPHGAGRNFSRSAYLRENAGRTAEEMIAAEAPGVDVRYFSGAPDLSELPGAYKNAEAIREQIDKFDLATIVDEIEPIGNIMAGDWQRDAPWRKKREQDLE